MVEKLGSDQSQIATLGGAIISSDGAPLLSGESDGSQSVMFGPAALRELQSTIANGDWAITPQDAFAEITTDNPLPYWDVSSGGVITVKIVGPGVHSFNTGTGNCLYFTVPPSTPLDATKSVYRMVPIASSQGRAFSYYPEAYGSASDSNVTMNITTTYYTQDLTSISGGPTAVYTSSGYYRPSAASINMAPPTNAAFMLVSINVTVNAAGGSGLLTVIKQLTEVRIVRGDEVLMVSEQTTPGTYAPSLIEQKDGVLTITPASSVKIAGANSLYVSRASVASATQSLVNNTSTTILLDTASTTPTTGTYDPNSWFNNANDRIAIGQAGFYVVTANLAFAANATGRRTLTIAVNGSDAGTVQVLASPAGSTLLCVSTNLYLAAGDLVTMTALQQSGGALSTVVVAGVYPALSVGRIGA